eukprot:1160567-Pelagomonas_calceolata.AAC.5
MAFKDCGADFTDELRHNLHGVWRDVEGVDLQGTINNWQHTKPFCSAFLPQCAQANPVTAALASGPASSHKMPADLG